MFGEHRITDAYHVTGIHYDVTTGAIEGIIHARVEPVPA